MMQEFEMASHQSKKRTAFFSFRCILLFRNLPLDDENTALINMFVVETSVDDDVCFISCSFSHGFDALTF